VGGVVAVALDTTEMLTDIVKNWRWIFVSSVSPYQQQLDCREFHPSLS
jgi:hypothetical protein